MVSTTELITFFRRRFEYRDGSLYWREGRYPGMKAGSLYQTGYLYVFMLMPDGSHKKFLVHRIIFAMEHGYMPDIIDHIDQDKTNNLISNLREATRSLNNINRGLNSNNTSGIKGVSFGRRDRHWYAKINIQIGGRSKLISLGQFKTIEDATAARQQAERHYWADIRGAESSAPRGTENSIQATGSSQEAGKSSELRQRIWSQPKEDSFDIPDAITYGY